METIIQNGASFISEAPLTTDIAADLAQDLLLSDIDSRITKVKPMATPIDQITRHFPVRKASSMKVDYYSIEAKAPQSTVKDAIAAGSVNPTGSQLSFVITPEQPEIFDPSETILLPAVNGDNSEPLVLYVLSRTSDRSGLTVVAINPPKDRGHITMPAIPADTPMVRMGRAAAELDVQTAQFEALPVKAHNLCQIFKMQVEQSTLMKMAEKEVNWNFSDQEEVAVADMRMGMEKSFLFGIRAQINDPIKRQPISLTGGIWNQAESEFGIDISNMKEENLIELCSQAFVHSSGSGRKFIFAGTGFVNAVSKIDAHKVRLATETHTRFGLQFHEIVSNFGTLCLIYSPIFDQCGHMNDALIIDPDLVTKYCHIPFRTEQLDLRTSGLRNTDAVVITEASCLVLRQPNAHMRVINVVEPTQD